MFDDDSKSDELAEDEADDDAAHLEEQPEHAV